MDANKLILLACLLTGLCACGSDSDDDQATADLQQEEIAQNEDNSESETITPSPEAKVPQLDCVNWQTTQPQWLWCDDFETLGSLASHYQDYSIGGNTGFDISQNDHFAGDGALQQFYRSGQVDAGWISWFYADALGQNYSSEHNTIFFRWYHKFEAGFEGTPPKMARIRRLEAGYVKSNAVHVWIDTNSSFLPLVADIYAPDSTQANNTGWFTFDSNFHYSNPGNIGRWICHEVQLSNNTPGLSDGNVTIWIDNNMIINQENVDLRGNTNKAFNEIMLDTYWNGGSPKEQSRYFDNFVIATQRIGCQEVD